MNDSAAAADPRDYLMRQLRQQLGRCETPFSTADRARFSSGAVALDRLLPGGGLRHDMLVEWFSDGPASGAATLSLLGAREACRLGGFVVVIDRRQMFYPPAAAAWGIDLDQLIVVHPRSARDELWAAVQSLRSPVVAAVWAAIHRLDDRAFRRLQLAAEAGRTLGLLLRPASARGQPSWADVRLFAKSMEQGAGSTELRPAGYPLGGSLPHACGRRVQIRVLRCHAGRSGSSVVLDIDDVAHVVREVNTNHDAHSLPVVAELADPTARPFSAGA